MNDVPDSFKNRVTLALEPAGCNKRTVRASLWRDDRLITVAVSGPRRGMACLWRPGMGKDEWCAHAEHLIFDQAHGDLRGTDLYITRDPCSGLACRELVERYQVRVIVIADAPLADPLLMPTSVDICYSTILGKQLTCIELAVKDPCPPCQKRMLKARVHAARLNASHYPHRVACDPESHHVTVQL